MLWSRLWHRITGKPDPSRSTPIDPDALDVVRRQHAVAKRLSKITGRSKDELLDYRRADRILARRGR